jgi:hypothetical protein
MNKYDDAITKLEGLRASIDEQLAVVRADAVADRENGSNEDDNKKRKSTNPFSKMRNTDGTVNATAAAEVAGMVARLGTKKCEEIARAAGKTLSGLPLR